MTKRDTDTGQSHWTPRVRQAVDGRVCWSPEIYCGPRGAALWPTAAPHIIIILACAAQRDEEGNRACAVKNGTETPPSGTWHDTEGDIKGTRHWVPLA